MKQKILLPLSILSIIMMFLYLTFKITHSNTIISIIIFCSFILISILNLSVVSIVKNKIFKFIYIIINIIMILLICYIIFLTGLNWFMGSMTTIDKYHFPDNNMELLKNVYYADMTHITAPIQVVYEKKFILGIKCSVIIKSNSENIELFDLEAVYNEIKDKNYGFCLYKLRIE